MMTVVLSIIYTFYGRRKLTMVCYTTIPCKAARGTHAQLNLVGFQERLDLES